MELRVNDKKELKIIDAENLLSGNVNSYDISLVIDESYKDFIITLIWKNRDIIKKSIITNETESVKIPHEVLVSEGELIIGLFAEKVENDKLIQRNSVNLVYLPVTEGSYTGEGTYTEELTPTILEKYLQEMKNFYNENLEEYNANAQSQLNKYNDNADSRLKEYNNNVKIKTYDFNSNAENRKKEIDQVAEEVAKNKTDIEEIEKRVSASEKSVKISEANAKESEESAKTSEANAQTSAENAQKSAENASKVLNDVTAVEKNINTLKGQIDTAKTNIDQSVEDVNKAVEELEISLENKRIESDKKYATAIESDEIVIEELGQVELDQDGYMKDVEILSGLKDIIQDVELPEEIIVEKAYIGIDGLSIVSSANWITSNFIKVNPSDNIIISGTNMGNRLLYSEYKEKDMSSVISGRNETVPGTIINLSVNANYIRFSTNNINATDFLVSNGKPATSLKNPANFKNLIKNIEIQNSDYVRKINLLDEKFLGNFKGYKNFIKYNKMFRNLKILTLNGTENWIIQSKEEKTIRFRLDLANIHLKKDAERIMYICNSLESRMFSKRTEDVEGLFIGSIIPKFTEIYIRVLKSDYPNLNDFVSNLKSMKKAGTPVQILYVTDEEIEEELSQENLDIINNLEVYAGLNDLSINDCILKFKVNRDVKKFIEENNANLQAQIDEIKALLNSTSTASLLAENLAKDNESEVI